MILSTMAVDQYDNTFHDLGKFPRKALLQQLDRKHADKMYVDVEGISKHVGYIIAGHWLTLYTVSEWKREA